MQLFDRMKNSGEMWLWVIIYFSAFYMRACPGSSLREPRQMEQFQRSYHARLLVRWIHDSSRSSWTCYERSPEGWLGSLATKQFFTNGPGDSIRAVHHQINRSTHTICHTSFWCPNRQSIHLTPPFVDCSRQKWTKKKQTLKVTYQPCCGMTLWAK